ncbi:hypothetical protein NC651_000693 [Populus alba x Populus x berolinensis]|nr:hypothetical protein NC651_000693 [Populus alba x Populus x berolinensis]
MYVLLAGLHVCVGHGFAQVFQTSCLLAMLLWAFTAICWELSIDALGRIYLGGNGVEDCLIREVVLRLSDHPLAYFKSL